MKFETANRTRAYDKDCSINYNIAKAWETLNKEIKSNKPDSPIDKLNKTN